ncbi:type II toxin-antitoxin system RelE/ParE family toxin [Methylomonas sp. AM2-LC]|uniref:type II toxin-antitoxin system RelE family toxin n=1 Tax=Methylomonas sp. AM2-LC TaxID=3153301 RepID=UPI003267AA6C
MAFNVTLKPSAQKALLKLPRPLQTRILDSLESLTNNPRPVGVKKLQSVTDLYRIRIGDYRVIYSINDHELLIYVLTVGHRREVYRD